MVRGKNLPDDALHPRHVREPAGTAAGRANRERARLVRDTVVKLAGEGFTVAQCLAEVNRSRSWYQQNRERHPAWAAQLRTVRLARNDPTLQSIGMVDFRMLYFKMPTAEHHLRIIDAIERARPDSITLILAFPGAAKTSLLIDKYCHWLAHDPNMRICVISEGQDLARKIIGQVGVRMTDQAAFAAFHNRYGPFRRPAEKDVPRGEDRGPKRAWNADYLQVLKSNHDEKEPSLEARGATGRIYGGRYDEMILDDVQSNETLGATDNLIRSLRTTWLSRPVPGHGKTTVVGSKVGPGDFYQRLEDLDLVTTKVQIPILTKDIPRDDMFVKRHGRIVLNPDCDAEPTWDYLNLQALAERRAQVGEEVWARTYMQHSVSQFGATYTETMLADAKDRTRGLTLRGLGTDVWASVDPALDTGICAYMVAAISPTRIWIGRSITRTDTHTYADVFEQINLLSETYRPSKWIVEQNNFQKGLLRDDRLEALARTRHFEVMGHNTGRNKDDDVIGVRMMANSFLDTEIMIPWGDEASKEEMGPLIDELRMWRPRILGAKLQQDRVMTLWMLWKTWQNDKQEYQPTYTARRPSWVA